MKNPVPVSMSARLLDLFYPEWAMFINTKMFDILDPDLCILGQLYKDADLSRFPDCYDGFDYFTYKYNKSIEWTCKYNFNIHYNDHDIDHLTALWLNEINDRLNA